jgi:hypothetical protein
LTRPATSTSSSMNDGASTIPSASGVPIQKTNSGTKTVAASLLAVLMPLLALAFGFV